MTTAQRVDRLEGVTEEILASLKRLEKGQARSEIMLSFVVSKLLSPVEIREMKAQLEQEAEQA